MSINFLKVATDCIGRGLSVIPLLAGQKDPDFTLVPRINGEPGTGGAARRTRDLATIQEWARRSPGANVGACSDEAVTILETDNEEQFRQLVRDVSRALTGEGRELPLTLTSQARPGRPHFFFLATDKTRAVQGAPGIQGLFEWRNMNQYVVGPGSLHPTGATYRITNDMPMVPMPGWLVAVLLEIQRAYRGEHSRVSKFVRVGPAAIVRDALLQNYALDVDAMLDDDKFELHVEAGERHYFLQSLAGLLHDGVRTEDELCDVLKRLRDKYCEAGKGDYEVENLASWTIHQAPSTVEPNLPAMSVNQVIYRDPAEYERKHSEWVESGGWRTLFHTWEETVAAKPLKFVIENFLQEKSLTMLGGPPASMKTYVALTVAKALITGEPLFGMFQVNEASTRVLYLIPESSLAPFAERLKKLDLVKYVGTKLFYRTLDAEGRMGITDERLLWAAKGADVILDTAVRFMVGDENAAADQRAFADNLFAMLKAGARTVIGLHHSPKSFGKQDQMTLENILRGSGDIGAMLATCWGLAKIDAEKSQIYVENVKDRDFRETPKPFVIEGRPHLDESGKFKLLYAPGTAPTYESVRQAERGKRGGRPKSLELEDLHEAAQLRAKGVKDTEIAERFGVDRKTLSRQLGPREKMTQ